VARWAEHGIWRREAGLLPVLGLLVALGLPQDVRADCALIPTAVRVLSSENGGIDRPFGAPGDTITLLADAACKPGVQFPHFSPAAASNQVTLRFTPPNGGPVTTLPAFPASSVANCGTDRCFALEFEIPNTTNVGPMVGTGLPLTGPAEIEVRNQAAGGALVATVGELYEPTLACNPQNRFRSVFEHFTVLPPRNSYTPNGSASLLATVDGSGSLLIPFAYGDVLASTTGGAAALRLLSVKADLANGLSAGNGLAGLDGQLLRLPRARGKGRFVRSFSFEGRPIPPLLEVTSADPLVDGSGVAYGDTLLGSVDFLDSVIRIAKKGPSPQNPSVSLQLFALAGDPGGATLGAPALVNGAGPIVISNVTLQASAAAPLNSLSKSDKVAVLARDEALESRFPGLGDVNGDPDSDDRVVEITSLANGSAIATMQAVTEIGVPKKATIATAGARVAFLQSEAHQGRTDFSGELSTMESVLRVWSADGSDPLCSGTPCEVTSFLSEPALADPSFAIEADGKTAPVAVSGDLVPDQYVFFATRERDQCPTHDGGACLITGFGDPFTLNRYSTRISQGQGGSDSPADSWESSLSGDGRTAVYVSNAVVTAPVVWETATYLLDVNGLTGAATGTLDFDPGAVDVLGLDYSGENPATQTLFSQPVAPTTFNLWGSYEIDAGLTTFSAVIDSGDPAVLITSAPFPFTNSTTGTFEGRFSSVTAGGALTDPSSFGLSNFRLDGTADVVDGSIVPGGPSGIVSYQASGIVRFLADYTVSGEQIYARALDLLGVGGNPQVVSVSNTGAPGNYASGTPRASASGEIVVFHSYATNLAPGDEEEMGDVFVRDLGEGGGTTRVSEAAPGVGGDLGSFDPAISGDGRFVAYTSDATNLVPPDTTPLYSDVFLFDRNLGTTERVSIGSTGSPANSGDASVSFDGRHVAFRSQGFGCGTSCIYVRDRVSNTTELVSVGANGNPNNVSVTPDISADGRFVVFVSYANNLAGAPPSPPNEPHCYLRDRERGVTQLVDLTLGGAPGDGPCASPRITESGRYVAFSSYATNLHPEESGPTADLRAYVFDRVTGVVELASPAGIALNSERVAVSDGYARVVAYATNAPVPVSSYFGQPLDSNGVSDIYGRVGLWAGPVGLPFDNSSLDGDSERSETVLRAFDGTSVTPLWNSGIAVSSAVVGGGRALLTPNDPGANAQIWQPGAPPFDLGVAVAPGRGKTAIAGDIACVIDPSGQLYAVESGGSPAAYPRAQATRVKAVTPVGSFSGLCVYTDAAGVLGTTSLVGFTQSLGVPAEDFQVNEDGIAFRSCESHPALDQDKNGDGDKADCVMRFWRFQPVVPEAQLVETNRSAVPCTFPGCDPFFEPYRVQEDVLSFVSEEPDEMNAALTGQRGVGCLSTSPPAACDLTGDRDGDDIALEVFSLASGRSQTFPLSKEHPPVLSPFPTVKAGDDSVLVIQLPAGVLGEDFASLPPGQLVTVLAGDTDADATFDQDGIEEPLVSRGDNCAFVSNGTQSDADGDGLGAGCDVTLASQAPGQTAVANDDPVSAPAPAKVPGSDLCDLNKSGKIIRPEVDQVWSDRGTRIAQPTNKDLDPELEPSDDRDPDADGVITASDFRLCLARCDAQTGGCSTAESGGTGGGFHHGGGCGLGFEVLIVLVPLAWRRRRTAA